MRRASYKTRMSPPPPGVLIAGFVWVAAGCEPGASVPVELVDAGLPPLADVGVPPLPEARFEPLGPARPAVLCTSKGPEGEVFQVDAFDAALRVLRHETSYREGRPSHVIEYRYDPDGRWSRSHGVDTPEGGEPSVSDGETRSDEEGRETFSAWRRGDTLYRTTSQYPPRWIVTRGYFGEALTPDYEIHTALDAEGRPLRSLSISRDGTEHLLNEYTYAPDGSAVMDAGGEGDRHERWALDAQGNLLRNEIDFDGDGSADRVLTFGYEAGRLTWQRQEDPGGQSSGWRFTYDEHGITAEGRVDGSPPSVHRTECEPALPQGLSALVIYRVAS